MKSLIISDLFHIENNVYCNSDTIVCRLHKLIMVYYKNQNVFTFFVLKKIKESNIISVLLSLVNSDSPVQHLKRLIGENIPDPLTCQVDEYECRLVPQCLGNFNLVITFESLEDMSVSQNRSCIVFINGSFVIDPIKIFRLICSVHSPNTYARTMLIPQLNSACKMLPNQTILLLTLRSLKDNINFLTHLKTPTTIHIIQEEDPSKPVYPGINYIVVYLVDDKHLAEPLLPDIDSDQPRFTVKRLSTLKELF